jgi:hypothetical protein
MKRKEIIERVSGVPAWALSPIAAFLISVIVGILNFIGQPYTYVLWSLMNASASFLICIIHPKSVWIVPLLCNILLLLPATLSEDGDFWTTSFGLIMGIGLVFSVLMAHLGALIGRRKENRKKVNSNNHLISK